ADHHVDSRSQGFDLWLVRSAAVDRRGAYTEVLAGFGDVLGDLLAQFAGRYDHQYLWGSVTGKLQPVQQRHAEAVCLPRAGPCLPDQVLAGHGERQRQFLDRERVCQSGRLQRRHDFRANTEVSECGFGRGNRGWVVGVLLWMPGVLSRCLHTSPYQRARPGWVRTLNRMGGHPDIRYGPPPAGMPVEACTRR